MTAPFWTRRRSDALCDRAIDRNHPDTGRRVVTAFETNAAMLWGALAIYVAFHLDRPLMAASVLRDSLSSFLYGIAIFSLLGLLPTRVTGIRGGVVGPLNTVAVTALSVLAFEVVAPAMGRGVGDLGDAVATVLGAMVYHLVVGWNTRHNAGGLNAA